MIFAACFSRPSSKRSSEATEGQKASAIRHSPGCFGLPFGGLEFPVFGILSARGACLFLFPASPLGREIVFFLLQAGLSRLKNKHQHTRNRTHAGESKSTILYLLDILGHARHIYPNTPAASAHERRVVWVAGKLQSWKDYSPAAKTCLIFIQEARYERLPNVTPLPL